MIKKKKTIKKRKEGGIRGRDNENVKKLEF